MQVKQWGIFELPLKGPEKGNPFLDIQLSATFKRNNFTKKVAGFYDGNGIYKVRFMPDKKGTWTYTTSSNYKELRNHKGSFQCTAPSKGNHGPVRVKNKFHFVYEDGTPFFHMGTTCYGWIHQENKYVMQTLKLLKKFPFNKVRMLLVPWNRISIIPVFEKDSKTKKDTKRFNPAYFKYLEEKITQLRDLGIEADCILYPFYQFKYGEYIIKYLMARISSFRNIWFCLANEFNPRKIKMEHWDTMFKIVRKHDPYNHLRSIHNGKVYYDHTKPWVTHCAIQHQSRKNQGLLPQVIEWREKYKKPIVLDEIGYEGDVEFCWGNLTAEELIEWCWTGYVTGGYPGHGETFKRSGSWSGHGRIIYGKSIARLAFMKKIMDEGPETGMDPINIGWNNWACGGIKNKYYIYYLGRSQPVERHIQWPKTLKYKMDIIDTWNMTITPGRLSKGAVGDKSWEKVKLPGKPFIAIRIRRA